MLLLEQRSCSVFKAAPVKQNIPKEALEKIQSKQLSHNKIINILYDYAKNAQNTEINNTVIVI